MAELLRMFPNTQACSKWLHPVFIHLLHIGHYFLIVDTVINIWNLGWNWLNGVRTSGTGFPQAAWVTGIYWQSSFWQLFSVSVLSQEVLVIGLGGHRTSLFRHCCMKLPPTPSHPFASTVQTCTQSKLHETYNEMYAQVCTQTNARMLRMKVMPRSAGSWLALCMRMCLCYRYKNLHF